MSWGSLLLKAVDKDDSSFWCKRKYGRGISPGLINSLQSDPVNLSALCDIGIDEDFHAENDEQDIINHCNNPDSRWEIRR